MRVFILSAPGREEMNRHTFARFQSQNPGVGFTVYVSSGKNPIADFWGMLHAARGDDVLALEDDVITTRNFFRYAAERWSSPHLTSFFHVRRPVLRVPVSGAGFTFNQAIKIPAPVLERLLELPLEAPPWLRREGSAQDDDLGYALEELGEPVVYHRSLVQHVGARSAIWSASATLEHRQALDFPGLDYDCLAD